MIRIQDQFPLRRGAHDRRDDGMCAMEMVAWLAGEAHSDEPRCACPVIASYVRALNDLLPDDGARTRLLRPLVPKFVNTRGNAQDERRRGFVVPHDHGAVLARRVVVTVNLPQRLEVRPHTRRPSRGQPADSHGSVRENCSLELRNIRRVHLVGVVGGR